MGFSKVIYTYVGVDGLVSSYSEEIPCCCFDCESEGLFNSYQNFMNAIAEKVSGKYEDDESPDITPLNGFADFDKSEEE